MENTQYTKVPYKPLNVNDISKKGVFFFPFCPIKELFTPNVLFNLLHA